jgi:hypothetical protein
MRRRLALRAGVVGRVDGVGCVVLRGVRFEPRNIPDDFEVLVFGPGRFAERKGLKDEAGDVGVEGAVFARDPPLGKQTEEPGMHVVDFVADVKVRIITEEFHGDGASFLGRLIREESFMCHAEVICNAGCLVAATSPICVGKNAPVHFGVLRLRFG